jgi:predicted exporter
VSVRARWAAAIWLGFVLGCAIIVYRTEISTDLSAFLPRTPSPAQQVLVNQLRDGVVSRLMLIGIEGDDSAALARTSGRMAAWLRADERFASANNGEDVNAGKDRQFIWGNRYLLSPGVNATHFTTAALRDALEENLSMLGSPAGMMLQRVLPNDPTGELFRVVEQLAGQTRPAMRHGVWFSADGKRALLIAQTWARGYDIDAQEHAMGLVRNAWSAARSPESAAQRLLLSGPGVFSVSTRETIKSDALKFSMIATLLVGALLLWFYRSPRVVALGMLPVASGALAGVAAVGLGFGTVHGVTLGFGATLIGEGVDYAIYLFTQRTPDSDSRATFDRIWPTLRLGLMTSICGFGVMLFSSFTGLAQLGLFSIAGLVVAVLVTRYVLPQLLPAGFYVTAAGTLAPAINAAVSRASLMRYPLLALVLVSIGYLVSHRDLLWSDELASLSPVSQSDQQLDQQLRRDIGAPDVRHMAVVQAADPEAALQASEAVAGNLQRLIGQGALQGFEAPHFFLPSQAAQRARQSSLPTPAALAADMQVALAGLPFRAELFKPFLQDVANARDQPMIDRASLDGTSLAVRLDSLLVRQGNGWAAMLPLRGVVDAAAIERDVSGAAGSAALLLDLKRESDQLYQRYRREVIFNSVLGIAAIGILLIAALRSPRRVLEVSAPLAAAVIVTLAALALGGARLSIFHLVGLLLVVAVGSNYSLFFEQQAHASQDWDRTSVSLVFANLSTVIGFGVLSFSTVPLLHALGTTVGVGAILALVFSAVLITRPPSISKAGA